MFDFDYNPERRGTNSVKWDVKCDELPMWIADMDFETAPAVKEAIQKRAKHGIYGYTGVPDEWYSAITGWWKRRFNFTIEKEWLQFCTGIVPAISSIVRRVTNIGDNVAVLTPAYNIFFNSIENAGRHALECRLSYKEGKYSIDFAAFEKVLSHPLTTLLVFCNPHNPTGNIWTGEELAKVGALCKKHGVVVISDEIHCNFTMHGKKYIPFASVSEECRDISITCISASKTFNIAGLQSAAVVVPNKSLREKVVRGLNSDEVAEPNCFAIDSVVAAFNEGEEWLEALMDYLTANRKFVCDYLSKHLPKAHPVQADATYVVWIDCSEFSDDTDKLCEFLRRETGLILSAGSIFRGNGKVFVRLNTACNRAKLEDGLARFVKGVKEYIKCGK